MPLVACPKCGTESTVPAGDTTRCPHCRVHLVRYEHSNEWISPAEQLFRTIAASTQLLIEESRDCAIASQVEAARHLPPEWNLEVGQLLPGAAYTLTITPPGPVNVSAALTPPHAGHGWSVRIDNRDRGVDFPLFIRGGAEAAYFATVADAVDAAITALTIEVNDPRCPR